MSCHKCVRSYGFWSFVGDSILFVITCGLWGFGIIIREVRNFSKCRC